MDAHSASLKGRREQNEDAHNVILNINGRDKNIGKINLFSVFDGHGGSEVSAHMKEIIPKYLTDKRMKYPLSKRNIYGIYDGVQEELKKHSFSHHTGSTGLVVVQFEDKGKNYLNVINNGDSRCVLCRGNFAIPLTIDHKPSWPQEKNRIEQLGGKIVFDGYDWRINDLSVSRSFGDLDATPMITHRPDLYKYELDKNDKFFVIACDGLWDVLANHDVVNFVLNNCYDSTRKNRINKKKNIARELAEYAIKKGSMDNVSCIVVFLKQ